MDVVDKIKLNTSQIYRREEKGERKKGKVGKEDVLCNERADC